MALVLQTFRCGSVQCRVETFKGTPLMPLNCCPQCQTLGVQIGTEAK